MDIWDMKRPSASNARSFKEVPHFRKTKALHPRITIKRS